MAFVFLSSKQNSSSSLTVFFFLRLFPASNPRSVRVTGHPLTWFFLDPQFLTRHISFPSFQGLSLKPLWLGGAFPLFSLRALFPPPPNFEQEILFVPTFPGPNDLPFSLLPLPVHPFRSQWTQENSFPSSSTFFFPTQQLASFAGCILLFYYPVTKAFGDL